MEEVLREREELTEERFLKYVRKLSSTELVVGDLIETCNKIKSGGVEIGGSLVRALVGYAVALIRRPETLIKEEKATNTVILALEKIKKEKNPLFLSLFYEHSENLDDVDDIFLCVLYGLGSVQCFGLEGMKSAIASVEIFRKMAEVAGSVRIFRKKEVWGIAPENEEEKVPERFKQMFGVPAGKVLPCFFVSVASAFPAVYERMKICKEFYRKRGYEKEKVRNEFEDRTREIADQMFALVKALSSKDPKIKNNFIEYVFRLYEENKDREKTQYDRGKVKPDGLVICVSNVLTRLLVPISEDRKKAEEVPVSFISRCSYINASEMDAVEGKVIQKQGGIEEEKYFVKLYYAKVLMNQISYVPMGAELSEESKAVRRMKRHAEALKRANSPKYAEISAHLENLSSYVAYLKTLWSSSYLMRGEISVIRFTLMFLKKAMEESEFAALPIFVIEGTLLMMKWMSQAMGEKEEKVPAYLKENIEDRSTAYSVFCAKVLSHPKINVNYKQLAVFLLQYNIYWVKSIPGLVNSLVTYYIEIQKAIRHSVDRIQERTTVTFELNSLMERYEYREEMRRMLEDGARSPKEGQIDLKNAFLLHCVSSLVDVQERGFEELKKTVMIEREIEDAHEDKESLLNNLETSMDMAGSYFRCLSQIEKLLLFLMELAPRAFLNSLVTPQVVSMLNSSIISLAGGRVKEMCVRNKERCGFSAVGHLAARIRMYIVIKSQVIAKGVVRDGMFKADLFKKAVGICEEKGKITQGEKAQCSLFMQRVENVPIRQEEAIEVPEEFLDPLTFAPMTDPVVLKTSNTRVDRATAAMILMNDPIDPFTRDPLTQNDIAEDPELKKRIEEFIRSHRG